MAVVLTDGKGLYYSYWDEVIDIYLAHQHVAEVRLKGYGPRLVTEVFSDSGSVKDTYEEAYRKFLGFGFDVMKPDYNLSLRSRKDHSD